MKSLFIIFATLLSVSAFAQSSDLHQCIEDNDSTVGLEQCQHDEYIELRRVLRLEYMRLLESKKDFSKFVHGHSKWVEQMQAACTSEVAEREGGTSQGFAKAECLSRITQQRIQLALEMQKLP